MYLLGYRLCHYPSDRILAMKYFGMYVKVWKVYLINWKTENQEKLLLRSEQLRDKENSKFNVCNLKTLYLKFHFNFGVLR